MKTNLIISTALVGILLLSCDQKEKNSYSEAMQDEVVTKRSLNNEDGNIERLEDNQLDSFELADTLELPDPLLLVLRKNSSTSPDKIRNVRRYTEQGTDFYEITFDNPVKEKQLVTYDNLGKFKSPNLDRPNN